MVIITVVEDNRKRYCACCKRKMRKGDIIVRYEEVINSFGNTRMWFSHINCLIKKLKDYESEIEKKLAKIPKIVFCINRCLK